MIKTRNPRLIQKSFLATLLKQLPVADFWVPGTFSGKRIVKDRQREAPRVPPAPTVVQVE